MFLPSHHTALIFFSFFSLKLRDSLVSPCWASHLFCTMDDLELNLPPCQPGCWDHYSYTLLTSCGLDIDFGALCNTLATDFVIFCFFFLFLYDLILRDIAHSPEQPSLVLNL